MKLFQIYQSKHDQCFAKSEWDWITAFIVNAEDEDEARLLCSEHPIAIDKMKNPDCYLNTEYFACHELDTNSSSVLYCDEDSM